jgi:glycosyltransferase involved in cell wall biosynthesis
LLNSENEVRISIVVPNFNSGEVLERAILSLIAQDYPDLQLILADSESKDISREIIEKYRNRFDTLIIEKDKGQADGINKGFAKATGDIYGWLCADDELMPGALHHVAEIFSKNPDVDVVFGACERIFADGSRLTTYPDPQVWEKIGAQNVVEQPSTFWRASLHRKLGPLDDSYFLSFDWDYWCRMKRAGARMMTTDRELSRYFFSETNKTSNAGDLFQQEAFRLIRNHGPLNGALAYIFRFLYRHFDLKGCYDRPPTCSWLRCKFFIVTLSVFAVLIGRQRLYLYNWHFASCQQRGLKWW